MLSSVNLLAQPKKYGKVDEKDFEKGLSKSDSNFSAVILFDYSKINVDKNITFKVERHMRIKVINPDDLEIGQFEFDYNDIRYGQEFKEIKAATFNINTKGEIVKSELKKADFFNEDTFGGWKQIRFVMPNISKGSIIDIRYEKILGGAEQIPNWYFDQNFPVKWSEFVIEIPVYLRFSLVQNLNKELELKEVKETKSAVRYSFSNSSNGRSNRTSRSSGSIRIQSPAQEFRWVMKDIPGLEAETYMSSIQNYRNYIYLQYKGIEIPQYQISDVNNENWNDFASEIMKENNLGRYVTPDKWSKSLASEIVGDELETMEIIKKFFEYVNSFSVNDISSYYPIRSLEEVNSFNSGSRTELNLLLIKLLESQGLEADPVFLSTRDNGRILKEYILPDQFNNLITAIRVNDSFLLIDASAESSNILLPEFNLNGQGLIASTSGIMWVDLRNSISTGFSIDINAKITPNGLITGKIEIQAEGYDALFVEKGYKASPSELIESFIKNEPNSILFDSTQYSPMTMYSPRNFLKTNFELNLTNNNNLDEIIYFQPSDFSFLELESLEDDYRKYPLEFPYKFNRGYKMRLEIPKGYKVEELPEGGIYKVPGKQFSYVEYYLELSNSIIIERRFLGLETSFSQQDYSLVRDVINGVNSSSPPIVLIKE